jgi:hypothetical protein
MPPKSEKPSLLTRFSRFVKGRSSTSSSSAGRSQGVAETASTPAVYDSSTPSTIPLPLANNLTTSNVQGSVSKTSMQPSTNEHQRIEFLQPTASAPCLAPSASTPADRDPIPQSLIHPTTTAASSEIAVSQDPQDQLPPSHPPQGPSLPIPAGIALFESARDFKTGDFNINANNVNVFNEGGAQEHARM